MTDNLFESEHALMQ